MFLFDGVKDVFEARKQYENMVGIGLTPEGIEQNDIVYDFMTETIWYTSSVDLNKWVTNYAKRRYGFINDDLVEGWHLLQVCCNHCSSNPKKK